MEWTRHLACHFRRLSLGCAPVFCLLATASILELGFIFGFIGSTRAESLELSFHQQEAS